MDNAAPRVSFVIPSYNAATFLPPLCASLQAQTYRDFEVLIGDDGSTDATREAVTPYLSDSRFRLFRWNSNRGVNCATLTLLEQARGMFWAYPGADDILEPKFLECRLRLFDEHPNVGLVHGRPLVVSENGCLMPDGRIVLPMMNTTEQSISIIPARDVLQILLQHNLIITPSVMIRMSITRCVMDHMLTSWRYAQDWGFWLLHSATGWDFAYDDRPLVKYRVHPSSLSNDPAKEAVRKAEIRLVPLWTMSRAAQFSDQAALIWLRWKTPLYAMWLRRALALAKEGALKDDWLQLGAAAYYGPAANRVNLVSESIRHSVAIMRCGIQASKAARHQRFVVSGLASVDHPFFRRG